jgi:hypothetical protein
VNETVSGDAASSNRFEDDASIPVLTERLADSAGPFAEQHKAVFEKAVVAAVPPASAPVSATASEALHDHVRQAVIARLTAEYAAILAERLQPAIDAAAAQLAASAVDSLHATLTQRIEEVVAELQGVEFPAPPERSGT